MSVPLNVLNVLSTDVHILSVDVEHL